MKIANIYVRITCYFLQEIDITWRRIDIKYFMLFHHVLYNISIDTYKQEILQKCMLSDGVCISHPLNWSEVEKHPTFNIRFLQ